MVYELTINGHRRSVEADPDKPMLWVLREDLGLLGTKFGCGAGLCGACTIIADGRAVRSCLTSVANVADKNVTTIEGVADLPAGKKIVEAWIDLDVPQCGYCQAGQIMSATALLTRTPKPTNDDILAGMNGNVCRCVTYLRIDKAIRKAAGVKDAEQ